jgi:putative PIN family toxin of toxin-antitoxin system
VRVVLDTGVVISALLFAQGRLAWLRGLWSAGAITPLVSRATVDELIRVLAYPKFQLTEEEIQAVLAAYLPFCEAVAGSGRGFSDLPECSDPEDQEFLELAQLGKAQALVTGDRELLDLDERVPFAIVSPADLRERLKT